MKSLLAFLVAISSIVTLGDAGCIHMPQIPGRPYRGCVFNGKLYPFGHIDRTEDCFSCDCRQTEMSCCSLFRTPVSYDRRKCKVIVKKKHCDYEVVEKQDPSKKCLEYASVH